MPHSLAPGLGTQIYYGDTVGYLRPPPRSDATAGHLSQNSSVMISDTNQFLSTSGYPGEQSLSLAGGGLLARRAALRSLNTDSTSMGPSCQVIHPLGGHQTYGTQSGGSGTGYVFETIPQPQIKVTPASPPSGSRPHPCENANEEPDTGSHSQINSTELYSSDAPGPSSSQNHPWDNYCAGLEALNCKVEEQKFAPAQPSCDPIAVVMGHKYDPFNVMLMNRVIGQCVDPRYKNTPAAIATYHQLAMADDLFFDWIWTGKFLVNESYIFEYQYRARSRPEMPDQARRDRRVIFLFAKDQTTGTLGWHKVVNGFVCRKPCGMQAPPAEYEDTLNLWQYFFRKAGGPVDMNRYAQLVAPNYIDYSQEAVRENKRLTNMVPGPTASRAAYHHATEDIISSDEAKSIPDFIPSRDVDVGPIASDTLASATTSVSGPPPIDPNIMATHDLEVKVDAEDSNDAFLGFVGEFFNIDAHTHSFPAPAAPVNDVSGSSASPIPSALVSLPNSRMASYHIPTPIDLWPNSDVSAGTTTAPEAPLVPAGNDTFLYAPVSDTKDLGILSGSLNENIDVPPVQNTGESASSTAFDPFGVYGAGLTPSENGDIGFFEATMTDLPNLHDVHDSTMFWSEPSLMPPDQHPGLPTFPQGTSYDADPAREGNQEEGNAMQDAGGDVKMGSE